MGRPVSMGKVLEPVSSIANNSSWGQQVPSLASSFMKGDFNGLVPEVAWAIQVTVTKEALLSGTAGEIKGSFLVALFKISLSMINMSNTQ